MGWRALVGCLGRANGARRKFQALEREWFIVLRPACLGTTRAARAAGLYRLLRLCGLNLTHFGNGKGMLRNLFQRNSRQVRTANRSESRIGPRVVATLVFFLCFSVGFAYEPRVNCTFAPRTALRSPELRGGENVSINSESLRLHLSEMLRKD